MPETAEERGQESQAKRVRPKHEQTRSSCEAHFISLEKTFASIDPFNVPPVGERAASARDCTIIVIV